MKMIYQVKDRPKFGQVIIFAFQQLLAIMAATIAVPMIIGNGMDIASALFGAGVGTLVYVLFTKAKSPVFLGSSFAFLGSMGAAFAGAVTVNAGYAGLIIGAVCAGLVYVVIALVVKFAGVGWLNKLMPAVVIGPTVAIIGLSLAGNAVGDLQKTNYTEKFDKDKYQIVECGQNFAVENSKEGNPIDYYLSDSAIDLAKAAEKETAQITSNLLVVDKDADLTKAVPAEKVHPEITPNFDDNNNLVGFSTVPGNTLLAVLCGLITVLVVTICSTYGKKMAKLIPFIIGILAGYAVAAIFTAIGIATENGALKIVDFSTLQQLEGIVNLPAFTFVNGFKGLKDLDGGYIATIAVAYIPVAFVVFAEHVADHKNISSIIETDLLEEPGLHRTLLGDGVGSMFGAFFGGCPNTTYGESVACVAISRNASVITTIVTAFMAILISFVTPVTAFLRSIPSCVMGGVCMTLYGFIAVSGLKMLQPVDLNKNRNLFVASAILIAGIGGLALNFGKITITSIATALILGIVLNTVLSKEKEEPAEEKAEETTEA